MSSNKQELISKATPNMKLELVDNLIASSISEYRRWKEQTENITAYQMCSNKQELCSEATSNKINNQNLL